MTFRENPCHKCSKLLALAEAKLHALDSSKINEAAIIESFVHDVPMTDVQCGKALLSGLRERVEAFSKSHDIK